MNKWEHQDERDLLALLEAKTYDMLSREERASLGAHISRETYERWRRLQLLARQSLKVGAGAQLKPDPTILPSLKTLMASRTRVKGPAPRLTLPLKKKPFRRQLSVYQAIAAAAAILFAIHISSNHWKQDVGLHAYPIFADSTSSSPQQIMLQDEDSVKDDSVLRLN
ncbi:MAG: hypothetical protein D6730_03595 [Bacteroidetes bacterium]|nr:MAG: hypothetical protein D6730_03595 [Bacteroidota bacterium]